MWLSIHAWIKVVLNCYGKLATACKCEKIHSNEFSWFSRVPWKFFCEYKCFSLIILNNKHFWARQCKSICKNSMVPGVETTNVCPVNLSTSMVFCYDSSILTFDKKFENKIFKIKQNLAILKKWSPQNFPAIWYYTTTGTALI